MSEIYVFFGLGWIMASATMLIGGFLEKNEIKRLNAKLKREQHFSEKLQEELNSKKENDYEY